MVSRAGSARRGTAADSAPDLIPIALVVLLLLTPLYNIGEVNAYHHGISVELRESVTPLPFKLIKDVGMLLVAMLALARLRPEATRMGLIFAPIGLTAVISMLVSVIESTRAGTPPLDSALLIVAGARWLFVWFLAAVLAGQISRRTMRAIALTVGGLTVANAVLQLYQSYHLAVPGFGFNALGLAYRPAGFFINGYTAGFLACLAIYLAWMFIPETLPRATITTMALLSIWLSASGTALAVLAVIGLMAFRGERYLRAKLLILPFLVIVAYLLAPSITSRIGLLESSGVGRLRVLEATAKEVGLISTHFGESTNSGVILNSALDANRARLDASVVDSAYTAALANTGWLGLAATAFALAALGVLAVRRRNLGATTLVLIYAVMGASLIFSEAWPMNMLFAAALGYFASALVRVGTDAPETESPVYFPIDPRFAVATAAALVVAVALILAPVVPYEALRIRAQITLAAGPGADLARLEADARTAARIQPQRPAAYLLMGDLADAHAAQGDWAGAIGLLDAAQRGMPPRPSKTIGRQPQTTLYIKTDLVAQKMAADIGAPAAAALRSHAVDLPHALLFGSIAAALGRFRDATFWYRGASDLGASSATFMRHYGTALHMSQDPAAALAAFNASRTAPRNVAEEGDWSTYLATVQLVPALDAYTSDVCTNPARSADAENMAAKDAEALAKLADLARSQGRDSDAQACLALDARFKALRDGAVR